MIRIFKFCQGWERKPGGEETLLEKFTMVSKVNLLVSIGCENVEIIRITRANAKFGLRFKR